MSRFLLSLPKYYYGTQNYCGPFEEPEYFHRLYKGKIPMVGYIKNAVWIDIPQVKYKIKNNKKIGQDKHTWDQSLRTKLWNMSF